MLYYIPRGAAAPESEPSKLALELFCSKPCCARGSVDEGTRASGQRSEVRGQRQT